MIDIPFAVWARLLSDLLGGFTFADMDRALAISEARGATPMRQAHSQVRALVAAKVLEERDGRFVRGVAPLPAPAPKPPVPPRPVVVAPAQGELFGGAL